VEHYAPDDKGVLTAEQIYFDNLPLLTDAADQESAHQAAIEANREAAHNHEVARGSCPVRHNYWHERLGILEHFSFCG
jgi:hypothetical protein